ncbi:MAG: hypothetical protein K6E18_00605, partial [Lachnospiraceae bacterium]|nr:hypothetical protein [Lachnospiraceae bacterium]
GLSDPLSIEVLEGYDGRITLENVVLSSIHNRPCIQMSDRCCLTLRLVGSSKMLGGGIRVPESSYLTVEGDGSLSIHSEAEEGFGIGNDLVSRHGRIAFYQDGLLHVDMNGKRLIGIGAGQGGEILIKRGKYRIVTNGEEVVNIGSFEADCRMSISNCDIETETRTLTGVGIGSLYKDAKLLMECCKITNHTEGKKVVGIGSLSGKEAKIRFYQMNGSSMMNANLGCALGALEGRTEFSIEEASFVGETAGQEVYFFGGQSEDVHVSIVHAEAIVEHRTKDGQVSRMPKENLSIQFGKLETTLNGVKEVIQIDD